MGLLDKLLPRNSGMLSGGGWSMPWSNMWMRRATSGVEVDEVKSLSLSAVFAGVWLLSQIIGMLPRSVYKCSGLRKDIVANHPAHYLLHTEPNPEMTAKRFFQTLEFHRLLWGNAYAEIVFAGNNKPVALWPIEPWRVRPKREQDGTLFYEIDGGKAKLYKEDILHIPLMSFDGVCGRSWVDFAIESLGLGLSAQEFAASFFGNNAVPAGFLYNPNMNIPKERRDEFRASWAETHGGRAGKMNKTGILWGGWEYKPIQLDAEKSQLVNVQMFSLGEVARWLNIPPHMLRDLSRATFSNIEQQNIELVVYTISPVLVDYEQEFDRKLLSPPDLISKHNLSALLRGDSAARSEFYTKMFQSGFYTINDVLELEDMNPVEGGDSRFVPVNMQTLENAINSKPAAPNMMPGSPSPSEPSEPAPKADPNAPPPELAFRELVVATLRRHLVYEARCARQAAKKPEGFLEWLDGFYPRHQGAIVESLSPVWRVLPPSPPLALPGKISSQLCDRNKAALLDVSGACTAKTLESEVDRVVTAWEAELAEKATDSIFLKGDLSCLNC